MKKAMLALFVLVSALLPALVAQECKTDGNAAAVAAPKGDCSQALQSACKIAVQTAPCAAAEDKAKCADTQCCKKQDCKCTCARKGGKCAEAQGTEQKCADCKCAKACCAAAMQAGAECKCAADCKCGQACCAAKTGCALMKASAEKKCAECKCAADCKCGQACCAGKKVARPKRLSPKR